MIDRDDDRPAPELGEVGEVDEVGHLPAPDAEPTATELAQAATFAAIIDQAMLDRTPPAMTAELRGLVDTAMVIHARAAGHRELSVERQRTLLDAALASAEHRRRSARQVARAVAELDRADAALGRVAGDELTARRASRRAVPWVIAGVASVAAAAALVALITSRRPLPARGAEPARTAAAAPGAPALPVEWRTRASDDLVGVIPRAAAGAAADRIDVLFADRMSGFRDRQLAIAAPDSGLRRPAGGAP